MDAHLITHGRRYPLRLASQATEHHLARRMSGEPHYLSLRDIASWVSRDRHGSAGNPVRRVRIILVRRGLSGRWSIASASADSRSSGDGSRGEGWSIA
jgi:hypothetical protein